MSNNQKILILNTGGTFNKIYDQISGELFVPQNNTAINGILKQSKIDYITVDGMIFKDSLEINKDDRRKIKNYIKKSVYSKIIIVHGTDTMDLSAQYFSKHLKNKVIVITGSMVPYSIDRQEATANLMLALGFIQTKTKKNVYIAMHGYVKQHNLIQKNRKIGIFECQ